MVEVLCQIKFSTHMHGGGSVKKQLRPLQSNRGSLSEIGAVAIPLIPAAAAS
jgi:hypothetical protein